VAACQAGQTEKIGYYLRRSAEIGYDLSSYSTFADDPLAICLHGRPEWQAFIGPYKLKADSAMKALKAITDILNDTTLRVNRSLLSDDAYWQNLAAKSTAEQLIKKIQKFNQYPSPKRTGIWTLYHLKVNDTLTAPFLVYIPKAYDAKKASALYVFMHGGVGGPKNFGNPAYEPNSQAEFFKRAFTQNAFIIFPFGKKTFNWLYHQEAFETILNEVRQVKSLYHIDDNRVYIGGHSDGGRGAVWFAMNQATPFAAFYGICYFPSIYTGNTILRNLHNQPPFYGISATNDQLFPLGMVNNVLDFDVQAGGNWHRSVIKGTHGLPYATPDSIYFLFDTLARNRRDPAPKHLTWETDDIKNGRYYWVSIKQLDTTATPAAWHTPLNPTITNKDGKTGKANFSKHKSGAIEANVIGNVISIRASCVKSIGIDIVPGLVDLAKPVTIMINGQEKFKGLIKPDKAQILAGFLADKDRTMLTLTSMTFQLNP
jgi:predicted esterase